MVTRCRFCEPKDDSVIWYSLCYDGNHKHFHGPYAVSEMQEYVLDRPWFRSHYYTMIHNVGLCKDGEMTLHIPHEMSKLPEWVWEHEFEHGRHKGRRW